MISTLKRYLGCLIATLLLAIAIPERAVAQYYTWGADAASLKWRSIKTPDVRLIYPDTVDAVARRTLRYIEAAKEDISYGFTYPALRIPFVMHPENFQSNGLVMWLPKRIEFLTSPSIDGYSMLWTKQLVAHEYRHAVQYNNLNRGVVRWLSYILGEQGAAAGLLFLPLYVIEGDAVMMETSMSSYGRGLQPSFTMAYRAEGRDMLSRKNIDRWFCGSYIEHIPDHYKFGYQVANYAYTRYGENVWNKVASFGVHRPYTVATVSTALKRFYGTNSSKLVRATFNDLFNYWDSLPERENSTSIISKIDSTNYTTFEHPIPQSDGSVIALRTDFRHPSRFVKYENKGAREERIAYTGSISTRPTQGGDRLWWSEYRRSLLFEQRVNSQLCYMDLERGKTRSIRGIRDALYPTATGDDKNHIAYVEYTPNGQYSIVEIEALKDVIHREKNTREISRTAITFPTELHGLAWDDKTEELYFIATDDSGMWIGVRDKSHPKGFKQLNKGAYITISDLRAKGGVLYFGSIESGYDELHSLDIESGEERRISQSKYGSFDPSTPSSSYIYSTTYDKFGYHLSRQEAGSLSERVKRGVIPQNIVNPKRAKWDVINLDTVRFTPADSVASHECHKSHKYNKSIKLFNIHSWMPVASNPFEFAAENRVSLSAGATILSQNLLSSAESYLSVGYNKTEGTLYSGGLKYDGLGVDLELAATYGGNQVVYDPVGDKDPHQQSYFSVSAGATLPFIFPNGYHTRQLSFTTLWNYTNGLILDLDEMVFDDENKLTNYAKVGFNEGLHKITFGVGYSDSVRSALRDIAPPFAYTLNTSYSLSPSEGNFSDLLSFYAKVYTRGLFPYNSFSLAGNYQTSIGGYQYEGINLLSFQSAYIIPTGYSSASIYNDKYRALKANYQLPLCYPEGGIGSILYMRRVRLNLGFDFATFEMSERSHNIYSYGANLIFDINALRLPDASTTSVQFSLYRLKNRDMNFQFSISLPI